MAVLGTKLRVPQSRREHVVRDRLPDRLRSGCDEPLTGWARDVMVCSAANVVAMLTSRPHILEAGDVQRCVDAMRRSAVGRATQRTSTPTRQPSAHLTGSGLAARPRRTRKVGRLVATLLAGTLFLWVLMGGGLEKAGQWVGEQMVEQMDPADPAPTEQPASREKQQQKRQPRQGG